MSFPLIDRLIEIEIREPTPSLTQEQKDELFIGLNNMDKDTMEISFILINLFWKRDIHSDKNRIVDPPYGCELISTTSSVGSQEYTYDFDFNSFPDDLLIILNRFYKLNITNMKDQQFKEQFEKELKAKATVVGEVNKKIRLENLAKERKDFVKKTDNKPVKIETQFVGELNSFCKKKNTRVS